jgi:uncharacterized protein YbjT (DUF2867 family)
MAAELRFAAYQQVFQELLNPASLLGANQGGINVVLVRSGDWPDDPNATEFVSAVRAAAPRRGAGPSQPPEPADPDHGPGQYL